MIIHLNLNIVNDQRHFMQSESDAQGNEYSSKTKICEQRGTTYVFWRHGIIILKLWRRDSSYEFWLIQIIFFFTTKLLNRYALLDLEKETAKKKVVDNYLYSFNNYFYFHYFFLCWYGIYNDIVMLCLKLIKCSYLYDDYMFTTAWCSVVCILTHAGGISQLSTSKLCRRFVSLLRKEHYQ